ncbi:MAG: amidophosphoribosyltransferase [Firmicutes bacterium]|jgi:amidophosphoribosyltransferase|nr:amidophosphoribosyltransferase [Bacillota bacterium]
MDIFCDKLKEECGVIGIFQEDINSISRRLCFGLVALQHRGQESAGISVINEGKTKYYKDMGLVQEVFDDTILDKLEGTIGVGHVRYSTTGDSLCENAQPLVVNMKNTSISLAHNGNLINATELRDELYDHGSLFQTSIDSEVIANLIAVNYEGDMPKAVSKSIARVKGSFALVIGTNDMLIGLRDPFGLRPLVLGKLEGEGYVFASETCALDVIGAEFVRNVEKGEMVIVTEKGVESIFYDESQKKRLCSFEYVYFARPDSDIDEVNVFMARERAGRILANESPVEGDMVIAVPDSGIAAAIGYAKESGIPYGTGLIKNKYLGRTFIKPDQKSRELAVRLKLNVLKENIKDKRVILIDDSIVRGTTSKKIVTMLRNAGAKEVHVRVSSPPVMYSCYFGIDTPSRKALVGAEKEIQDICDMIGADSLAYISIDGLKKSIGCGENLCMACFDGDYPMEVPKKSNKFVFEKN